MTDNNTNLTDLAAFKCGTVAIVGRPNVGKSTLLNHILGMKLAITSRKAQTTRHRLLGIHTTDDTQFLFVDTPGFQQKHLNALNKGLNKTVTQVLTEVDVVLFVIEPMKLGEADRKVLQLLSEKTPTILVVNKADLMGDKGNLLPLIQDFDLEFPFSDIVPVSAKKSLHLDELLQTIRKYLPTQEAIYSADELTDKNERFLAAELVREKIFRLLGDEIPYSVAVEIEKFEVVGNLRRIFCAIIVDIIVDVTFRMTWGLKYLHFQLAKFYNTFVTYFFINAWNFFIFRTYNFEIILIKFSKKVIASNMIIMFMCTPNLR